MSPFETKTKLMAHQREAVAKVLPSRVGALFMEMGTGKSRTAIELAKTRARKISKVVWLCPVSLKETVRQEILKHTDCEDVYVFDEKSRPSHLPRARWYVVGLESISGSDRVTLTLNSIIDERTMMIVDESSYIKGHRSKRSMRVHWIGEKAKYRLILTGTPLSQGVVDLYAQMRFLSPKILGYNSFYSFAANHLEYSDKFKGMIVRAHNVGYLAAKIAPYAYQVTKEECLDLPSKVHDTRYVRMTEKQEAAYQQAKEEILMDIDDLDDFDSVTIFRLFTALQSIVCGFWHRCLTPLREMRQGKKKMVQKMTFEENRTEAMMDAISSMASDDKVVIWAKFRYCIDKIAMALTEKYGNDSVALFHGGLSENERNAEIDKFRNKARFFVATQSAGGHGLTLNEAHNVIFYADGFKYSERLQAEDRCHRIGQEHKVLYVSLCAPGTIDDRIMVDPIVKTIWALKLVKVRLPSTPLGSGSEPPLVSCSSAKSEACRHCRTPCIPEGRSGALGPARTRSGRATRI